ncbi:MAG TPA: FliG C-terminal domain-containing protein [Planctomycetota bacterium]|nr:FliG C-terminal domain-containing protein [Planctomycetota bacterium]
MKCCNCPSGSEGYAVIPGLGEAGEARFYCDRCARNHRVKMRYWDGRDLDVGGYRESPDLGKSFHTLIFSFYDVARMRREDLEPVMTWVDDEELALALDGAEPAVSEKVFSVLPLTRVRRIRDLLASGVNKGTPAAATPEAARELVVSVIKRL